MTLEYKRKLEEVCGGNLYTENMKTPHKRVQMDLNQSLSYSCTTLPPTFLFFLLYQSFSTNPPVFSSTSILRIHQLWLFRSRYAIPVLDFLHYSLALWSLMCATLGDTEWRAPSAMLLKYPLVYLLESQALCWMDAICWPKSFQDLYDT